MILSDRSGRQPARKAAVASSTLPQCPACGRSLASMTSTTCLFCGAKLPAGLRVISGDRPALPPEALILLEPRVDPELARRRWLGRMIAFGVAACVLGLVVAMFGFPHHRR